MTAWTHQDIAELIEKALTLALAACEYCEHCTVAAILPGDKYCLVCASEITDTLAVRYDEQKAVDGGLY